MFLKNDLSSETEARISSFLPFTFAKVEVSFKCLGYFLKHNYYIISD